MGYEAYKDQIEKAADYYEVPREELFALVEKESSFNPKATSKVGAYGLTQLMPETAKSLGVDDINDTQKQLYGGAKYLRQQFDKYNDWNLAHAAYNWGPGNVDKLTTKIGSKSIEDLKPYLPEETRGHVDYIANNGKKYHDLYLKQSQQVVTSAPTIQQDQNPVTGMQAGAGSQSDTLGKGIDLLMNPVTKYLPDYAKPSGWATKLVDAIKDTNVTTSRELQSFGIPSAVTTAGSVINEVPARMLRTVAQTAESTLSPLNAGMMALNFVAPGAAALANIGFTGQQLYQGYQQGQQGVEEIKQGDYGQGIEDLFGAGLNSALAVLGAKQAKGQWSSRKAALKDRKASFGDEFRKVDPEAPPVDLDPNQILEDQRVADSQSLAREIDASRRGVDLPVDTISPFEMPTVGEGTPGVIPQQVPLDVSSRGRITQLRDPNEVFAMSDPSQSRGFVMDPEGAQFSFDSPKPQTGERTFIIRKKTPSGIPLPEPERRFSTGREAGNAPVGQSDIWSLPEEFIPNQKPGTIISQSDAMLMPETPQPQRALPPPSQEFRSQQRTQNIEKVGDPYSKGMEGLFDLENQADVFNPIESAMKSSDQAQKQSYESAQEQAYRQKEIQRRIDKMEQEPADITPTPQERQKIAEVPESSEPFIIEKVQKNLSDREAKALKVSADELAEAADSPSTNLFSKGKRLLKSFVEGSKPMDKVMARDFGKYGGELVNKFQEGMDKIGPVVDDAYFELEQAGKANRDLSVEGKERVFDALQDRKNAERILSKDPNERILFNAAKSIYADFKAARERMGLKTLDDYATHFWDTVLNAEDFALSNKADVPRDVDSVYSKRRTDKAGYKKDIYEALEKYIPSMGKMLSTMDAVDFYHSEFLPNVKGTPSSLARVRKYAKDMVSHEAIPEWGKPLQTLRNWGYKVLNYSGITLAKNYVQHRQADMFTTSAGRKVGRLVENLDIPEVNAYLNGQHTSLFDVWNKEKSTGKKVERFQKTESRNWRIARAKGMGESIYKSKIFKDSIKQGMDDVEATYRALQDPKTLQAAMKEGEFVARKSQYNASLAYKPEILRTTNPFLNLFTMFHSFSLRSAHLIADSVFNPKESRARELMERGFTPEASVAELYVGAKEMQKNVRKAKKMFKLSEDKVMLSNLEKQVNLGVKELEASIKQLNPRNPAKSAAILGGIMGVSIIMEELFRGVGNINREIVGLQEFKDKGIMNSISRNTPLASLSESGNLNSPVLPRGNILDPEWYLKRGIKSMPYVGVAEGIIPGNLVTGTVDSLLDDK